MGNINYLKAKTSNTWGSRKVTKPERHHHWLNFSTQYNILLWNLQQYAPNTYGDNITALGSALSSVDLLLLPWVMKRSL